MSSNPAAPEPGEDPVASSIHMWGLRLWIVCALLIVGYAVANYLLNHWLPS